MSITRLNTIANDYRCGEITAIFFHNRKTQEKINTLTLFELVPFEQESSPLIGNRNSSFMDRESVNQDITLYITRLINLNVADTITKYVSHPYELHLAYENLNAIIKNKFDVVQEPPDYNNLLIDSREERTFGRVLPKRNTSFRVWSQINTNKEWLKDFEKVFFDKVGLLTRKHLGFDLSIISEHIGNAYLFGSNPFLRKWSASLLDLEKDLLIRFYEREGKSIIGSTLCLEEERANNKGFTMRIPIDSATMRISLPYFPVSLRKRIYDQAGNLIDHTLAMWRNIETQIHVQDSVINLDFHTRDGVEIHSIPKTLEASTFSVGKFDFTTAFFLKQALDKRKFEDLEKSKEFIFFPKHEASKAKAKQVVNELLNSAKKTCYILDSYFGSIDLIYAISIQNVSVPIQVVSSAMFLSTDADPPKKGTLKKIKAQILKIFRKNRTHADVLLSGINEYQKGYPVQKIICKVLKGSKSPLHDRYIIVDDSVYLLGSSLNEFGARATTIIKVPTPDKMIAQAIDWCEDEKSSIDLDKYVHSKS